MKLKNKKTGETGYYLHTHRDYKTGVLKVAVLKDGVPFSEFKPYEPIYDYDSLAELNEEWCDYEEPKEYWHIFGTNITKTQECLDELYDKRNKEIGNYFDSREEAEKAVEKLKAFKRLKDKGFSIYSWDYEFVMVDKPSQTIILRASAVDTSNTDLDLLFSGEDD